jgi:hypothetical protein
MTLFYAATQHFSSHLAIIVQASATARVFTFNGESLLFAEAE